MSQVTVRELAEVVGTPVDRLLVQLGEAGLPHSGADEPINDGDKAKLLSHLRQLHGKDSESKKITLKRKSVSELRQGKKKTVNVEVRKRRTYVRGGVETAKSVAAKNSAESINEERIEAAKRALQEEAKRRQSELDESLREEQQARETEEALRKARPPEKTRLPEQEVGEIPVEQPIELSDTAASSEPEPQPVAPIPVVTPIEVEPGTQSKPGGRRQRKHEDKPRFDREELHVASEKSGRRKRKSRAKSNVSPSPTRHAFEMPTAPIVRDVPIPETIRVGDLAQKMSLKATDLIKAMMGMGSMVTINQVVDQETAAIVVEELGHRPKIISDNDIESEVMKLDVDAHDAIARSPVVTIMGHVDHGKTSLLDYIRRTRVAEAEAGGITQHIGAYTVNTDSGGKVTFLDTPGHAAFTAMRARGAKSTDIVILVVAADDGVMPQTIEAVQHSKAADVPMIVAVNKIDKEGANPERVMQDLANHDVIPESWGGDTMYINVSALTGEGVGALLDSILLQAELMELRAPVEGAASGVVIESRLDRGRGPVATILVQAGTLQKGDMLLAGQEYGRVRGVYDQSGGEVLSAGPSTPVEVLGLSGPPDAGDDAISVLDERKAREIALFRQGKYREVRLARQRASSLESVFEQMGETQLGAVNIVLKADVHGSVEALRDALSSLSSDEVRVSVVAAATGGISETDVNLAIASSAILVGFNVRADATARKLVEQEGVTLHYFSVIYDVIDTVKQAITGMLSPEIREQIVGIAEVRDVFRSRKLGSIAGCMVTEGIVKRMNPIRVLRDNVVIYEGELESLRRFREDVSDVRSGTECGIGVRNYNDVKVGDQIEVFEKLEIARTV